MSDESASAEGADTPPRRRSRGRIVAWVAGILVLLVAGLGAWLALDALRARDALTELTTAVPALMDDVRERPEAAAGRVTEIQQATARAKAATSGPHWTIAGWLPWIGDNTRALQAVTTSVDRLAVEGLPGLASAVASLTPENLAPRDGRIDTGPLQAVHDEVVAGSAAVDQAHAVVAGIDRTPLIPELASAVERLTGELADAKELTSTAAAAVTLIPPLLGADEPRDWLVLAQNNAESRATGGIPGAVVLLHADDGRLSIVEQQAGNEVGGFDAPVLPLDWAEESLFGPDLGLFMQDVNLTPDFPRSAELAVAMWERVSDRRPVNVLSLDPVALAAMLTATGPVEFGDPAGGTVTLTAKNTAGFLMSEVYSRYPDPQLQDAVFALATRAVLEQLMSSSTDSGVLLRALTGSMAQHRLLLWSADPAEQTLIEQAGVAGALRGTVEDGDGVAPAVGVFFNITSASKLGYYLDAAAELANETTAADGARQFTLRVRLSSRLKESEVDALPRYVTGSSRGGAIDLNVLAYAPSGGDIATEPGDGAGFTISHNELQVSAQTVAVLPEQTVELAWLITTGADQPAPPVLRLTPGARNP